jgi:hypothetical protein
VNFYTVQLINRTREWRDLDYRVAAPAEAAVTQL